MQTTCIACGFHITHEIYHGDNHPLSVLHLPRTKAQARDALKLPMNFRSCARCGHIFNVEFDYYKIPYEDDSNLMYNKARMWMKHMEGLVEELVGKYDAKQKTLVDIGCGDGGFLKILLERNLGNRCIGFEPGVEAANAAKNGLEVHKDYFIPERDLKSIRPDFLICRHVIEHLKSPLTFVSEIAYWCNVYDVFPLFLAESPRIDNAIEQGRINDFLYEHPSNFTQRSFQFMFETGGWDVVDIRPAYGDEVVVAVTRPRRSEHLKALPHTAKSYSDSLRKLKQNVGSAMAKLADSGRSVAFWGATGKGSAFLNIFDLFDHAWPVVVDSDYNKVGRFVPRTGQEIHPPEYLVENPVDTIVITTQWRAEDIAWEIQNRRIPCREILVLVGQELQPLNGRGDGGR